MNNTYEVFLKINYNDTCATVEERILYDMVIDEIWHVIKSIASRYHFSNGKLVNGSSTIMATFSSEHQSQLFENEIRESLKKYNCTLIAKNRAFQ